MVRAEQVWEGMLEDTRTPMIRLQTLEASLAVFRVSPHHSADEKRHRVN